MGDSEPGNPTAKFLLLFHFFLFSDYHTSRMADPSKYQNYTQRAKWFPKQLRKRETKTEKIMWSMLCNDAMGYRFTRQKPLGIFIADFYCAKLQLVVEVDGGYHKNRLAYDRRRDGLLAEMWIKVYRIRANSLYNNPDWVLGLLMTYILNL